ncbi:hypothetical protein H0H92_015686, partial [Tricholoma furcatifolium]
MKTGRPEYWIPSESTIRRDTQVIFARTREHIGKILQEYEGKVNFQTDGWTSPNHRAFVAVIANIEMNGTPISLVLDIVEVAESHTGEALARAFTEVLKSFGIEEKEQKALTRQALQILSCTSNNASNNDMMTTEQAKLLPAYLPVNRCQCFLHVCNLVEKSLLRHFNPPEKKGDGAEEAALFAMEVEAAAEEIMMVSQVLGGDDDDDAPDEDNDENIWVEKDAELTEEERAELNDAIRPVRLVLVKLRRLAFKMINSTMKLLPAWKAKLEELGLNKRLMPRNVRTRWNSTYNMLTFALEYQEAITEFTKDRGNNVRNLELSSSEWDIVTELAKTLKPLKDATLLFSKGTPNLPYVIPVMDQIDTLFTNALRSTTDPAIHAAIKSGKATLNRYYSRTDEVEIFHISMVLHPRHKLTYFKNTGWQLDWIDTARDLVRNEFERMYLDFKSASLNKEDAVVGVVSEDTDDEVLILRSLDRGLFLVESKESN